MNFQDVKIAKKGSEIITMSERKRAKLMSLDQRIDEMAEEIQRSILSKEEKKVVRNMLLDKKDMVHSAIDFCNVIVDHLSNSGEYMFSISEINFFYNDEILDYTK